MTREDRLHHLLKLLIYEAIVAAAKAELAKRGKHALTFKSKGGNK